MAIGHCLAVDLSSVSTPKTALIREIKEETGLDSQIETHLGVDSCVVENHDAHTHNLRLLYRASIIGGSLRNEVQGTTDEARWIPLIKAKEMKLLTVTNMGLSYTSLYRKKYHR